MVFNTTPQGFVFIFHENESCLVGKEDGWMTSAALNKGNKVLGTRSIARSESQCGGNDVVLALLNTS